MSVLLGTQIIDAVKNGKILIEPFVEEHVGPNSVDVTLANKLVTYTHVKVVERDGLHYASPSTDPKDTILDMAKDNEYHTIEIPSTGLVLLPDILYLGATNEKAGSDHFVPMYEGRSSLARLGIQSHLSAGFGDICFKSNWTLEITVVHPTVVYPNKRIGQVYFHDVDAKDVKELFMNGKEYTGKYTDQPEPQPSKSFLDFKTED